MKYTLGLDLGTTSVGWAVVDVENKKIADLGVRIFESAENPKDGRSLAEPRRIARSTRRRLARRGYRLDKIKSIFTNAKLLTPDEIKNIHSKPNNPYQFRAEGLDRVLTNQELFIAIYHLAKRRGYKSNRKKIVEKNDTTKDSETKAVLDGIKENKQLLREGSFRTVGEMLYATLKKNEKQFDFVGIRNKPGLYKHSVSRQMLTDELQAIFDSQKRLGNTGVAAIEKDIVATFLFQRHYAQGEILKNMVGTCTFEEGEMRAAKATYSFQYFNLLQKLNHMVIHTPNEKRPLASQERQVIIDKAMEVKTINYGQIKKWLNLNKEDRFNITYSITRKDAEGKSEKELEDLKDAFEKKEKFPSLRDSYEIRKKIIETDEKFWNRIEENIDVVDKIGEILTLYKTDDDILKYLRQIEIDGSTNIFPHKVEQSLLHVSFTKFGHLSLKALRKIIPDLEKGLTYDKAVEEVYKGQQYKVNARDIKLRPISKDDYSITNPVVKRTISQTIKVVNAVIDKHGSPLKVHIELGRELSKNKKERDQITKSQQENKKKNEHVMELLQAKGITDPSGQDIVRFKLWQEQSCKCAYSGKPIDENRLLEDGYTQIDHIIPFSRSFDDSYNNKVLVLTEENQEKLNNIPYEVFGHDEQKWQEFKTLISSMSLSPRKKYNLLLKKYISDELTIRTLNDSRYIAKYLKNYIEKTLLFAESDKKRRVITVNGATTAYLRSRWGLNKNRIETDKHHAQDAIVVAVTSESLVKNVALHAKIGSVRKYLKIHKTVHNSEVTPEEINFAKQQKLAHEQGTSLRFPEPWEGFSDEVVSSLHGVFVSRMPRRKTTGQVHDATLRSPKLFKKGEEKSSVRKPLTAITRDMLEKNKSTIDPGIYDRLVERLESFNGDAKKAFAEPFYKIRRDGTDGPVVRSLKITEFGQKSGILINHETALVDRASMIRVDVFSKRNKKGKDEYYFIPIYAHHVKEKFLPNKVVTKGKPESEWETIDDTFTFKFSLYPGDLIKVTKGTSEQYWYYVKAGIATNSFTVASHDRSEGIPSMGIKTLDGLEKYVVDILGAYHKVDREKRQSFKKK